MSILIDENTRVIVQGITGRDGSFHARAMREYGTKVVGGVTPGKGGAQIDSIPVFETMAQAARETGANASVIFVPAKFATAAIREAAESPVELIVCITEGIPVQEMIANYHFARSRNKRLIGPNCPGLISPGKCKIGIMPAHIHKGGPVGVISRSGTLTYEVVYNLTKSGMGQSTCVGIGGDPVIGTGFAELLEMFQRDPGTESVVLIGEIGGGEEGEAAAYMSRNFSKKAAVFISGRTAPPGRRMGHAGAIISGSDETAESKTRAFMDIGVPVVDRPDQIPDALRGA
ncbi:MAG: succinate--CoA ligase subunit alpha [Spirochaetes bacterium]|nr:MAG: succinate--CoA ligase subunit alpha [Spirochaetota bacterium]